MANIQGARSLVRSKKRVTDHGEVFTPGWMAESMIDLVKYEANRIDARFLEPACGSGNFLVPVLRRKLATVKLRHGRSEFEKRHFALFALMCVYGIELLQDNAAECRQHLAATFNEFLQVSSDDVWSRAAEAVLALNVVQGDALAMVTIDGQPISFPEWSYLGRGRYQRRDFRFDSLTGRSSFGGTLWEQLDEHEIFVPIRSYPPMTVQEVAK